MNAALELEKPIRPKAYIANVIFGKFRVLEICAGYGSQAMALKNLGLDIHADIAEIDKYAIQAYNQLHGETFNYGDVYKIDETKLPSYDLITYSTPCQDFSVAGKQQGGDKGSGTRSSLLWECERIIKAVKPKYLLMENVKNLVGKKHKHNFDAWLKTLEQLGYNNYWQVLNAKDYGVPQNRERVFVVSIRKDLNKIYTFPPKQELKIRLKDILESNVDEKYYLSDEKVIGFLEKGNVNPSGRGINGNVCNTLTTNKGEGLKILEPVAYDEQNKYFRKDGCVGTLTTDGSSPKHNNRVVEFSSRVMHVGNITGRKSNGGYAGDIFNPEGLSPTLNTMQGGNRMPFITEPKVINPLKNKTSYGWHFEQEVYDENGIARAVKAGGGSGNIPKIIQVGNIVETDSFGGNPQRGRIYSPEGCSPALNTMQGGGLEPKIYNNYRIRKLTPRECWRLMGMKDEQFDKLHDISNSQLYKLAGNSIVVDVLEHIFRNLLFAETVKPTEQKGQLQLL